MKIALISDTHDQMDMIRLAVERIKRGKVEAIVHCGDFIAPFTIPPFKVLEVPFISIFGNNDGEKKGLTDKINSIGGMVCYQPLVRDIGGKKFLISHEPIPDDNVKRYFGDVDFYVYGHTHEVEVKELAGIKVINPGELCGWLSGKSTFMLLDTESGSTELIYLKGGQQ